MDHKFSKFFYFFASALCFFLISCNFNNDSETCFETSNRILGDGKISFLVEENCFNISYKKSSFKFTASYIEENDVYNFNFDEIDWLRETYNYIHTLSPFEENELYEKYPKIKIFFNNVEDALRNKNTIISEAFIKYANSKLAGFIVDFPEDREMKSIKKVNNDEHWFEGTMLLKLPESKLLFDIKCEYLFGPSDLSADNTFIGQTDVDYKNRDYGDIPEWLKTACDYYYNADKELKGKATELKSVFRKIEELFFERLQKDDILFN